MLDTSSTSQSDVMTVKDVSQYLRLTERSIYTMLENGVIPGVKFGSAWRVSREQLKKKLEGK